MITREADYAVRTILFLSRHEESSSPTTTKTLSEEMHIPYRFLRGIVRILCKAELVTSRKGKGGGLTLARQSSLISLKQILELFDPRGIAMNGCCVDEALCELSAKCPVHNEMVKIQHYLDETLSSLTFDKIGNV